MIKCKMYGSNLVCALDNSEFSFYTKCSKRKDIMSTCDGS